MLWRIQSTHLKQKGRTENIEMSKSEIVFFRASKGRWSEEENCIYTYQIVELKCRISRQKTPQSI